MQTNSDKQHYIHSKAPRHQGKQTKQHKKDLVQQRKKPWNPNRHRWEPHRSGYHCSACGTRTHQGLTTPILEARLQETCPQLQVDASRTAPPHTAPALNKKITGAQNIKELLQAQADTEPGPDQHHFEETKGYLKCTKCGSNIHKRTNEEAQDYINSPCLDQAYADKHEGHNLWQKGERVSCTPCGLQWHLDSQKRIVSATGFHKKGAGLKGSPPLQHFFKPQSPARQPPRALQMLTRRHLSKKRATPAPHREGCTSAHSSTCESLKMPRPILPRP